MEHFQTSSYLKHVGAPFLKKKEKKKRKPGALSLLLRQNNISSLNWIISKISNNEIQEVQKNWRYMCSFWIRVTSFLLAISSCFPPHNATPTPSLHPHPSPLHPTLLHSFHCPAHVLNLPDENRSHCSTTIEWLMQERWTLMDFFFFFFNVLKIEYKAWPPDVVDPFQQPRYCL